MNPKPLQMNFAIRTSKVLLENLNCFNEKECSYRTQLIPNKYFPCAHFQNIYESYKTK
jgi:hypothetical protein